MADAPALDAVVQQFIKEHGHQSALTTATAWQKLKYLFWIVQGFILLQYDWKIFFTIVTGILGIFYLATIGYKLLTVFLSVVWPGEMRITRREIDALDDESLPIYTILLPVYKEATIVDKIVSSILSLDYPRDKLDVLLLLEEDDDETRGALEGVTLPECVRPFIVPPGYPKTKPRACEHGLVAARGEYLVIYDAEDRPEYDQLKKAVVAFRKLPERVMCLQAKLNYYNPRQNWLTKWFTLEYTTWFDLFLPGLNRLKVPIPLGGTSNHFKTKPLREVGGWDPFNVAEDCDLGMRLHSAGYRTMVLDSTTWEEANCQVGNWIRQRSRWVKGYIQTHLVHTRERMRGLRILFALGIGGWVLYHLVKMSGHLIAYLSSRSDVEAALAADYAVTELTGAAIIGLTLAAWGYLKGARKLGPVGYVSFQLTVGGLSLTLLLNPVFWVVGIAWLWKRWQLWYPTSYIDDTMTRVDYWSVASHWFWWIAVLLLAANGVFIVIHLLACARRKLKDLTFYAFASPLYWGLISIGAWRGFLQLMTRAHYWDKTVHGLDSGGASPASRPGGKRPPPKGIGVVPAGGHKEIINPKDVTLVVPPPSRRKKKSRKSKKADDGTKDDE